MIFVNKEVFVSSTGRSSPKDRIDLFLDAINQIKPETMSNYQERMRKYVHVFEEQHKSLPEVAYVVNRSCCSVTDVCKRVSCCFKSRCCTKEVYNYYVSEIDEDRINLRQKRSTKAPTTELNQLTNVTFFLDLYREFGEFLPFLMEAVIAYLPSDESKIYWLSWDPSSSENLDYQRAYDFRLLLRQASEVYDQVRMEMMKKEMRDKIAHSSLTDRESLENKQVTTTVSPRESSKKMLRREGKVSEFDRIRVKKDLLSITFCSELEADRAALEVEKRISDVATTQEVWDRMREVAMERRFEIKPAFASPITENLFEILEQEPAPRVIDMRTERFANLLRVSKVDRRRSDPRSDQRIQRVVKNKFEQQKQNEGFETLV